MLIPLFWLALIVVLVIVFSRRRAWAMRTGAGPWTWPGAQAARSAETTLAERFAQGDIEEQEYRARLEVLRANAPQPPAR
ncbi:MAG: hypothetical protein HY996_11155 [Micrococcales bacterium]|nr:hypothetical protein [Micrococcales bacterium]